MEENKYVLLVDPKKKEYSFDLSPYYKTKWYYKIKYELVKDEIKINSLDVDLRRPKPKCHCPPGPNPTCKDSEKLISYSGNTRFEKINFNFNTKKIKKTITQGAIKKDEYCKNTTIEALLKLITEINEILDLKEENASNPPQSTPGNLENSQEDIEIDIDIDEEYAMEYLNKRQICYLEIRNLIENKNMTNLINIMKKGSQDEKSNKESDKKVVVALGKLLFELFKSRKFTSPPKKKFRKKIRKEIKDIVSDICGSLAYPLPFQNVEKIFPKYICKLPIIENPDQETYEKIQSSKLVKILANLIYNKIIDPTTESSEIIKLFFDDSELGSS